MRKFIFILATVIMWMTFASYSADWSVGSIVNMAPNMTDHREQINPIAAFDGDSIYLVVWQQGRNTIGEKEGDIYAARIDTHGKLLDESPIAICDAAGVQESPRVAYNGNCFLVTWSDLRDNTQWDVYGMRVTTAGNLLDVKNGFTVVGGEAAFQNTPYPIADGDSAFLVAYQVAYGLPNSLYMAGLARVRNDGSVFDFGKIPNMTGDLRGGYIAGGGIVLAHFGGIYFLSLMDDRNAPTGSNRWRGQRIYFKIDGAVPVVLSRGQVCHPLVDFPDNYAIATDGENSVFLCSAIRESPRGGAHFGFPCAQFFTLTSSAMGLDNPNTEDVSGTNKPQVTGWDPSVDKTNFLPYAGSGNMSIKLDYIAAASYSNGYYIMLARRGGTGVSEEQRKSIVISRKINRAGIELGDNFEYSRPYLIDYPYLAPSPTGYLLVASEHAGPGVCRISAQFIQNLANDSGKPAVTSVSCFDTNKVRVVFSEPIDKATADVLANYSIDGDLSVISAVLQSDMRSLILTLSASVRVGISYSLRISGIRDYALPPNIMEPDTLEFHCDPLSLGLVSYWPLNDSTGANAMDVFGGNSALLQGGALWTAGKSGAAVLFDGTDDYLSTALSIAAPNIFTLSCWFSTSSTSETKLLGFGSAKTGNSSDYDRVIQMTADGKLQFWCYPGSMKLITGTNAYNDGRWHHVGVTMSAAGIKLYADGLKIAEDTSVKAGQSYAGYWRIGSDNAPNFKGKLDEVRYYNRALSDADMAMLFADTQGTVLETAIPNRLPFSLSAQPNPFSSQVVIRCTGITTHAVLHVFDINGRRVADFGKLGRSDRLIVWNGTGYPSGLYFLVLKDGDHMLKRRVMRVR